MVFEKLLILTFNVHLCDMVVITLEDNLQKGCWRGGSKRSDLKCHQVGRDVRLTDKNVVETTDEERPAIVNAISVDLRIVRGQNAQLGQFPWQAWIECIRFNFLATGCGGSLITTSHILTAAHCVDSVVLCQVSLGLISLKERGYSYFLHPNNMIIHGNYQADSYSNDIAIIRLRSSVKLTENIQPIRLAKEFQNSRTLSGMPAIVSGWGKTRDSEKGRHQLLQYGTVRIMPEAKCIPFFKRMFNLSITSGHICTDFSASNVCNGDSGGPLAIIEPDNIWTLIGIISLGVTPCEEGIPSVFTAVANYLPWIYNNTQK